MQLPLYEKNASRGTKSALVMGGLLLFALTLWALSTTMPLMAWVAVGIVILIAVVAVVAALEFYRRYNQANAGPGAPQARSPDRYLAREEDEELNWPPTLPPSPPASGFDRPPSQGGR